MKQHIGNALPWKQVTHFVKPRMKALLRKLPGTLLYHDASRLLYAWLHVKTVYNLLIREQNPSYWRNDLESSE